MRWAEGENFKYLRYVVESIYASSVEVGQLLPRIYVESIPSWGKFQSKRHAFYKYGNLGSWREAALDDVVWNLPLGSSVNFRWM